MADLLRFGSQNRSRNHQKTVSRLTNEIHCVFEGLHGCPRPDFGGFLAWKCAQKAIEKTVVKSDRFLGGFSALKSSQNASKIDAGKEMKSETKRGRGGTFLSMLSMFLDEFFMNGESLRPSIHSKKTE